MVAATKSSLKESEDLAAIQAQLQLERAKLTNEISTRLGSISPLKSNATHMRNPFSMPSSSKSGSSSSLSSTGIGLFSQRPATLGLGAEPLEQDRQYAANGKDIARLKGAIVGKRKRDVMEGSLEANDNEEEDSKISAIQKGKERAKPKVNGKADPFASKKSKASKGKENLAVSKAVSEEIPAAASASTESQDDMMGLSKAARKRLRKKKMKEAQANGIAESVKGKDEEEDGSDDNGSLKSIGTSLQDARSNTVDEAKVTHNGYSNGHVEDTSIMTAHQKSLLSHLSGARFRQINETLYTTSSSSAMEYIQGEPLKLQEYHDGFREQVKSWPKVPVRQIAEMLQKGQVEGSSKKGKRGMGRHASGALVVDLGAGEAILAKILSKDKSSSIRVLSYDLLDSEDGWVRGVDIAKLGGLGLPGTLSANIDDEKARIVDVAVFCLSLMGTNWVEMIMEASRVLQKGGELIIAEVTSRFHTKADFVHTITSLGFNLIKEDSSNTHFVLFEFTRLGRDQTACKNLDDADERAKMVVKTASILKPCIYKRR